MESNPSKGQSRDCDIYKAITEISFMKESYLKCWYDRQELEKQIGRVHDELKNTRLTVDTLRTNLTESKKLITEQQTIISKLVAIKNDIKHYKDDIAAREKRIFDLEQEQNELVNLHKVEEKALKDDFNKKLELYKVEHTTEVKNLKHELNIVTSEAVCNARRQEEEKLQLFVVKDEMINKLVLDYEEKLQRAHAQYMCLKDEVRAMTERYKNKIDILEQKNLPRTNVVPPNVVRNITSNVASDLQNHPEPHFARNQFSASSDQSKRQTPQAPGPYRLMPKGVGKQNNSNNNYNSNNCKPLQVYFTSPNVEKPVKRKLFNKNADEFQETE